MRDNEQATPSVSQPIPSSTGSASLSVAIVGCGIIGVNHARAIALHDELSMVAFVDSVPAMACELANLVENELALPRPQTFETLAAAFARVPIDIVVICTPSGLHVQLAEEAVASGAHVVIEKPLDVTMERARRLAKLADEAEADGQLISVISQHRFDPSSVVVARAAHSGEFGRITSGVASVAWWRDQQYYDSGAWRGTWRLDGGGAVMNQGVHTVDLLVWFLGRPIEVSAHTALLAHEKIEVEDVAVATVRFESGALAVLHATTAAYPGLTVRLQVHGSRGSAIIDNDLLEYFHAAGGGHVQSDAGGADDRAANQAVLHVAPSDLKGGERAADAFARGHYRQYVDIVDAIRERRAPGVRVADALLSLAVVRSIYVSATLGRPIPVDGVLSGEFDDIDVSTEGIS